MRQIGALSNIKVLDMGRLQAGPICASIFGAMGADVIKLEDPNCGDLSRYALPPGGYYATFNHSKRGITLDLKCEKGKEIFVRLVKDMDIIIENFRPGVMKKLGLDYCELKKINPGLIYAAVSGFGQEGVYSQRAAMDPIAQGMSGMSSMTGFDGHPPVRCGATVCDIMAGLHTAIGILVALNHRNLSGEGQMIDIALCDVGVVAMSPIMQQYLSAGVIPKKQGNSFDVQLL